METEELLPYVYDELRRLASRKLAAERPGHTLQTTALVHEAYLRLVNSDQGKHWESTRHFLVTAAEAMRRLLIEHARRRAAEKRGSDWNRVPFHEQDFAILESPKHFLDLDSALTQLQDEDPLAAELVKLRLYAGLSIEAASQAVGVSRATGYRLWTYARAWLAAELHSD